VSDKSRNSIAIRSLHPILSEGYVYAVLESYSWDFKTTGPVHLVTPIGKLRMSYAGAGDAHGAPYVKLVPEDEQQLRSLEDLLRTNPGHLRMERVTKNAD
jgi:hypothetical protein